MASGNTLVTLTPNGYEPTLTNPATIGTRNGHPVLNFDATTAEGSMWTFVMPLHYSNATGITVYIHFTMLSATTGNCGWLIALERLDTAQTVATDGFASDQTVTAVTVPGTAGLMAIMSLAITAGANMDSVVAGDTCRLRIKRDATVDTATADAQLVAVHVKET